MRTYKELLEYGKRELKNGGIENGDLDAWFLMEAVFQITRAWYFAHDDEKTPEEKKERYIQYIEKRKRHIPLQQITGEAWFFGLKFFVNQYVLVPRQDTECLVERVLKEEKGREGLEILDMCTGSGCILLSLLKHLKGSVGTGVDLSKEALQVAKRNGESLGRKAEWVCGDLFEKLTERTFDVIVSNPPYIRTQVIEELMEEVRLYEPRMALDGKEDGLYFYRKIIRQAGRYLKENGLLAFEIGYDQGEAVAGLMKEQGYRDILVEKDLAGLDRVVSGRK